MSFLKDRFHGVIKKQGLKAGLIPVADLNGENDRLNEIKRLDLEEKDLSNDRHLNNVTELACYLTEKPQSTINLLTDKSQLSKNNHGFSIPEQILVREIPRDISLCQYVLKHPREQLVIENVRENNKTQNFHKMAFAPDIQFYAGTPIVTSKGFTVGTLCVTDSKPGRLPHNMREGLRLLSDQVSNILEFGALKPQFDNLENDKKVSLKADASFYSSASILFTDFVGFTHISEDIDPGELIESLDEFFSTFDQIATKHDLSKVKTIGDSYMATGGIPDGRQGHAKKACMAALDITRAVSGLNVKREVLGQAPWKIRVGVHTGPVIAGVSANGFDVWGDTVNLASRLESSSEPGKVHISDMTRQSLGDTATVTDRGQINIKNKGKIQTYFLDNVSD
ncbi:MAG: Adenylate cyclase [Alphaproteobacteria bacterium MarineAlpha11_Bin1]|nr:MAG: Adenylate cyclase [Alphaproteobacteria bacterium MarineAlpha11_Bin1]